MFERVTSHFIGTYHGEIKLQRRLDQSIVDLFFPSRLNGSSTLDEDPPPSHLGFLTPFFSISFGPGRRGGNLGEKNVLTFFFSHRF